MFSCRFPVSSSQVTSFLVFLLFSFFPSILPSHTAHRSESLLSTCPTQFFCVSFVVCINILFSFTISCSSTFVLCSVHFTFIILLHSHISNASSRFISPSSEDIFFSRFFSLSSSFPCRSSLLLLQASFPSILRHLIYLISLWLLQSSVTHASQIAELFHLFKLYSVFVNCYLASFLYTYLRHLCFLQIDLRSIFFRWYIFRLSIIF